MTEGSKRLGRLDRIALGLGLVAAANVLLVAGAYLVYPGYLEFNEGSVVAMAHLMLKGQPVYHSLESADRVSHVHGPMVFLWNAWPQLLFGNSVMAARGAAVLAAVLLPAVMLASQLRRGLLAAAVATAFGSAAILLHLNMSVVIRPDTPLTICVALAIWAAYWGETRRDLLPTLVIGLLIGLIAGFKVNAVLYVVPVALYHASGAWIRRLAVMGAVSLAVTVAPFLTDTFSLDALMSMVSQMVGKESTWRGFVILWWKFALYLCIPIAIWAMAGRQAWRAMDGRTALYLGTQVAVTLLTLYPATKIGASHNYLLPLVPAMVDLSLRALDAASSRMLPRRALVAAAALAVGLSWQPERRFFKSLDWDEARTVQAELQTIMRDFPGKTIQMGVGGVKQGDPLTFRFYDYRSALVIAGNPYTLDVGTAMELTKLRVPEPPEMIARLKACHTDLWLVPSGEEPFLLWGFYYQPVFSMDFRQTFAANHHKVASYQIYDVWGCGT